MAVEPLPGGDAQKSGNLRLVLAQGEVGSPIGGVPAVAADGQGGLLDARKWQLQFRSLCELTLNSTGHHTSGATVSTFAFI